MTTALGIDIGGTSVKLCVLGSQSQPLFARSQAYRRPDRDQLLRAIADASKDLAQTPETIGICAPGIFDSNSGRFVTCINIPGLIGASLDDLAAAARCESARASLHTDAFSAAIGFHSHRGGFPGRALALSLGTGVGACVLDDGVPLHISGKSPGHFGQLDVSLDDEAPIGPDGGRGGLEAYIGLPALRSRFNLDGEELGRRVNALTRTDQPLRALARAIRIGHAMFRPDAVWLLGGIGQALATASDELKALIDADLTSLARPGRELHFAAHAFHAAMGAAELGAR